MRRLKPVRIIVKIETRSVSASVSVLVLVAAFALPIGKAAEKDIDSVAGTYTPVLNAQFGDKARGQLILGSDGYYSLALARATLPKIAADTREKGTAEENKAIVGGSIFHFGKYMVDWQGQTITFNIEASSYSNWNGTTLKRTFKVVGDQLTYTNAAPSSGGPPQEVIWRRVR